MLARMWRNWVTYILLVECKMVQLPWKTSWQSLKNPSMQLPYDPAILLLGIYPRDMKRMFTKNLYMNVYSRFVSNSSKLGVGEGTTAKCLLMGEWVAKQTMTCPYHPINKPGWISPKLHCMEKIKKITYCMISFI